MISPAFYNKKNLVTALGEGQPQHYPVKNPSVTWSWYDYVIVAHETIYTIAARIFGQDLEYMWTLIADNNPPRHPDEWRPGDIIRLPKIIIRDSDTQDVITGTGSV